jgi:hypothetical protein
MSEDAQPDVSPKGPPTARNPESTAQFRREAWWQITFPVLIVALLSIGAVVLLVVLSGPTGASIVADYSLILVIIPNVVAGLIVLLLLGGLIYLLARVIRTLPPYTNVAYESVKKVHGWVDKITDRIAGAVIAIRSVLAGIDFFLKAQGIEAEDGPDAEAAGTSQQTQPESPSA